MLLSSVVRVHLAAAVPVAGRSPVAALADVYATALGHARRAWKLRGAREPTVPRSLEMPLHWLRRLRDAAAKQSRRALGYRFGRAVTSALPAVTRARHAFGSRPGAPAAGPVRPDSSDARELATHPDLDVCDAGPGRDAHGGGSLNPPPIDHQRDSGERDSKTQLGIEHQAYARRSYHDDGDWFQQPAP